MKTIGDQFKFHRNKLKISQLELEMKSGISAHSISNIEKGKTQPTLKTILILCESLEIDRAETLYLLIYNLLHQIKKIV
jgi:transcriptional regulator with XRE-family HTH domain